MPSDMGWGAPGGVAWRASTSSNEAVGGSKIPVKLSSSAKTLRKSYRSASLSIFGKPLPLCQRLTLAFRAGVREVDGANDGRGGLEVVRCCRASVIASPSGETRQSFNCSCWTSARKVSAPPSSKTSCKLRSASASAAVLTLLVPLARQNMLAVKTILLLLLKPGFMQGTSTPDKRSNTAPQSEGDLARPKETAWPWGMRWNLKPSFGQPTRGVCHTLVLLDQKRRTCHTMPFKPRAQFRSQRSKAARCSPSA
mmetsp:Transcript_115023/g.330445  ORF Transcript_115023/g.330445 Transcript_115023/m.330445 type:complete len:253 (+) Transcript_115023:220-978(+)